MTNQSDNEKIIQKRRTIQKIEFLPSIPVMLQRIIAISIEEFWKHTFAAGEAAKILAEKINHEFSSRAYIIGLLHDIGKIVLSFSNSSQFDDAVFDSRALNKPLYSCEEKIFGFDHQTAGGWLGERWQLPESILAGIKYHHNIEACPENLQNEAIIAHAANYLAKSAKFGNSGDERLWNLHPLVETKLNITSGTLDKVKSELEKKREEINMFLESIE